MRIRVQKLARPIPVTRVEAKKVERMNGVPMEPLQIDSTRPLRRDATGPITTKPPSHPPQALFTGELLDARAQNAPTLREGLRLKMPMLVKLDDGDRLSTSPITKVEINDLGEDALVTTESGSFYKVSVTSR